MKLSFPEAEVTKSLFKGLVIKQVYTNVDTEDKRVINTNELMKKRMAALEAQMRQSGTEGFQAGLDAKTVENLLADGEEGAASGNVVKASTESAEDILQQARTKRQVFWKKPRQKALPYWNRHRRRQSRKRERFSRKPKSRDMLPENGMRMLRQRCLQRNLKRKSEISRMPMKKKWIRWNRSL